MYKKSGKLNGIRININISGIESDPQAKIVLGSPTPPLTTVPLEKGVSISSLNPQTQSSTRRLGKHAIPPA